MPETGWFRGEGGVIYEMDLPLREVMQEKVTKGYLVRVAGPDGGQYVASDETGEPADPDRRPAQNAAKAEWVGYAVRVHGLTPDDAEAMTKADLIELTAQPEPPAE
jgi:hypothetical protein